MDMPKSTFESHLLGIIHNILIPTLDPRLRDALKSLMKGELTPEKHTYYLLYGMLNGFGIVHNKVGRLESQILSLEKQIKQLKNPK